MAELNPRVAIIVAIIGIVGTLGAALIANWDKIFQRKATDTGGSHQAQRPENALVPEKTVRELIAAWKESDRATALKLAEPDAIDKLFGEPALMSKVNSKELNCWPSGTGQRDCQIPYLEGILIFRLKETDQGWRVVKVDY